MSAKNKGGWEKMNTGWGFPLYPDRETGAIKYISGREKIRQSIWIILETEPMERVMLPEFGCGLRKYLMAPNNSATRALIKMDVERALTAWEPRIRLEEISVVEGDDPALVLVNIRYTHVRDNSADSVVYPLYME